MKTVFEGIVNGQKYDNVADYNAALTKAINEGSPVQASSQTYTQNEPEVKPQPVDKKLPNFYIGMNPKEYYMDMMTGDDDADEHTLEKVCEALEKNFEEVTNVLSEMTYEDLQVYLNNLKSVLAKLEKDYDANGELINQFEKNLKDIEEEMKTLKNKLNLCDWCDSLNHEMKEYYSCLLEEVQREMNAREVEPDSQTNLNTTFAETQKQQEILLDGVKKLLAEIFNK